nr:MAG: capsid protein [Crogonang virus 5]
MSSLIQEEMTIESVTKVHNEGVANSFIEQEQILMPQGVAQRAGVTFTPTPKKSQITTFDDVLVQTGYNVNTAMDPTFSMQDSSDDDLAGFFSRPIKIYSTQISIAVPLKVTFDPWTLFFTNPRVINRISNFYLLRCNLKLKFMINGNSFYYGRFIASYLPFASSDTLREKVPANRFIDHITLSSQGPHVFLDPTTSQGGDLTLPYFHPSSNLSITGQTWTDMGFIFIDTIAALQHANSGTDPINLTVFAYADDVHMSIPTSVEPASLSPQGTMEKSEDEVVTGKISGLASAAASGFKALAAYAPIAPYAMAASYGATMVAGVARLFGYSRPRITSSAPCRYKPEIYGNLANTDVGENTYALSLDSKNAVTIDPRVTGLSGMDEMTVSHIVSHESFFHLFTWSTAQAPETCLAQIRVDPTLYRQLSNQKFLTSTAYMATPFKFWTGTLNFRFQIICSGHHRGRLRIVYDPVSLGTSAEYNVNYTHIVDIAEVTDITVSIPPCQPTALMQPLGINFVPTTSFYTTGTALAASTTSGNGVIGVYVVNDLAIPSLSAAAISIACYVSGGDDFAVFAPTDGLSGALVLKPQGLLEPAESSTVDANAPISEGTKMVPVVSSMDALPQIFCGEKFYSIRPLLKRYGYHHSWGSDGTGTGTIAHATSAFPYNRGNVTSAITVRAGAIPYNYCNTTALSYFSYAYVGWRGSIRWKIALTDFCVGTTGTNSTVTSMYCARVPEGASYTNVVQAFANDGTPSSNSARVLNVRDSTGFEGLSVVNNNTNPVLEVELPYYSNKRFQLCALQDRTSISYAGTERVEGKITHLNVRTAVATAVSVDEYVAAGDDFSLVFYIGPPPLSFETDYPAV